jgi:hypothetical protein
MRYLLIVVTVTMRYSLNVVSVTMCNLFHKGKIHAVNWPPLCSRSASGKASVKILKPSFQFCTANINQRHEMKTNYRPGLE